MTLKSHPKGSRNHPENTSKKSKQKGPPKKIRPGAGQPQPVSTWNGKRGFVRDIACVRMCSVCIWTSPNECIPNRKSPEILQGFPMNTNGFPNNS